MDGEIGSQPQPITLGWARKGPLLIYADAANDAQYLCLVRVLTPPGFARWRPGFRAFWGCPPQAARHGSGP